MTVKMCMDIDTWCNVKKTSTCDSSDTVTEAAGGCEYVAGGSWDVHHTTSGKFTTACAGDDSADWLWFRNENVTQDVGACDSSKETWEETDECASGTTCGTMTLDKDTILGCWKDAECDAGKGTVTDSATEYTLVCGATKLFAATAAALAV